MVIAGTVIGDRFRVDHVLGARHIDDASAQASDRAGRGGSRARGRSGSRALATMAPGLRASCSRSYLSGFRSLSSRWFSYRRVRVASCMNIRKRERCRIASAGAAGAASSASTRSRSRSQQVGRLGADDPRRRTPQSPTQAAHGERRARGPRPGCSPPTRPRPASASSSPPGPSATAIAAAAELASCPSSKSSTARRRRRRGRARPDPGRIALRLRGCAWPTSSRSAPRGRAAKVGAGAATFRSVRPSRMQL
jgi:hypothetical protein